MKKSADSLSHSSVVFTFVLFGLFDDSWVATLRYSHVVAAGEIKQVAAKSKRVVDVGTIVVVVIQSTRLGACSSRQVANGSGDMVDAGVVAQGAEAG